MYGVILWSDPCVRKAVIWCEDQGSLAYYEAPDSVLRSDEMFFDTGDYVEFDVTMDKDLARAQNAHIVMPARTPSLPHTLTGNGFAQRNIGEWAHVDAMQDAEARVIQLADHRATPRPQPAEVNRRG